MGQVNLSERLSGTRVRLDRQRSRTPEPVPKFLKLTRKETRVRDDQYTELTTLTRSLMRERTSRRDRITENTLIRVTIDLLLAHRDQLRGSDEDELRRSVTSGVPDFRSLRATDTESPEVSQPRAPEARDSLSNRVAKSRSPGERNLGSSAKFGPERRSAS
ncbi:hypothetical protein GCM10007269_32110 [Microbacterium murale]|uniref:Uncharacterized protein n=1 Tax=Microbacterium murale TaxID=1081040 RepID=A0ABQ1RYQ0_9MICO|nr:hypothetical protein GCM10007269_32110 [Microbacterium murale]